MLLNTLKKSWQAIVVACVLLLLLPQLLLAVGPISPFSEVVEVKGDAKENLVLGLAVVNSKKEQGFKAFAKAYSLGTYYTINDIPEKRQAFSFGVTNLLITMRVAPAIHFRLSGVDDKTSNSNCNKVIGSLKNDISKRTYAMLCKFFKKGALARSGQYTNTEMFLVFSYIDVLKKTTLYGDGQNKWPAVKVFSGAKKEFSAILHEIYDKIIKRTGNVKGKYYEGTSAIGKPDTFSLN